MPPVNTLIGGTLAWRQHDGGHTDQPNWKHFIPWADKQLGRPVPAAAPRPSAAAAPVQAPALPPREAEQFGPADVAVPRKDANSMAAHAQLVAKTKQGRIDVYVLGDSIARRWGATDYPDFLAHWKQTFHGWNAADFGWGADRTQHILWRIQNGELDGVQPKVIVLLAGTNNVGGTPGDDAKVADITRGLKAIVETCRAKAPEAVIVLTAIFPRNDNAELWAEIRKINAGLAAMADGRKVRFLDVNAGLAEADGTLKEGMTVDKLHPSLQGYQVWADGLKPILTEILGPPAATDLAPPPTGNPNVKS
jgi:lysophospholipase L1-like esterase